MHTYELAGPTDGMPTSPSIETFRFHCAEDVVRFARHNPSIGATTWPETWHLGEDGQLCCYQKGSSIDSIHSLAEDPAALLEVRAAGSREGACTDRWVLVDSRPRWFSDAGTVDEADAAAFLTLRASLGRGGIELLDAVVFDDQRHWWSLHELTTGSTAWARPRRSAA